MKNLLFIVVLLFFLTGLNGQSRSDGTESYITCFYPVGQIASQNNWDQLVARLNTTEGIVKMKSVYKPEQGRGQLILLILAVSGVGENKNAFDLLQIKSLIIQLGMLPEEPEIKEGIHI